MELLITPLDTTVQRSFRADQHTDVPRMNSNSMGKGCGNSVLLPELTSCIFFTMRL